MFNPNNFYYVIRENFADPTNSIMWVPNTNGAKDFLNFVPYIDDSDITKVKQYIFANAGIKAQSKYIFMYDQEPLDPRIIDRFRLNRLVNEEVKLHKIIEQESWIELISSNIYSIDIPIWCHSEYGSPEIKELELNLFIPCYYWYHAFISRDWFRHYQYNRSLLPCDKSDSPYRFLLYARAHTGSRTYRRQIIDNLSIHKSKIFHNWDGRNIISPDFSAKIDYDDAIKAGIHLVAETLFETDKVYVTEKIFKPMIMSQPFIVWGAPGLLEYLRRYGFQTFDGIWSEEYDKETDHNKRMSMLSKLVNDIASLPNDQFKEIFRQCLPIIEHNRKWFFSQAFMDKCWQELSQNFQQSFERRQELLLTNPGGNIFYMLDKNPNLRELSRYKSIAQQALITLDDNRKQKILDAFPFAKNI